MYGKINNSTNKKYNRYYYFHITQRLVEIRFAS